MLHKASLARLLERLHPKWTSGLAAILLRAADSNGDETLDYAEFLNWLLGGEKEWDTIREAMIMSKEEVFEQDVDSKEEPLKREMTLEEAAEIKDLPELVRLRTLSEVCYVSFTIMRRPFLTCSLDQGLEPAAKRVRCF